mmetsp:Transcript_28764/g.92832  ORF Transcript_28764/g.92832 Transcript_28764/m.92832 type:complete len:904 (-) Transcript_28764:242-2953(-)
MPGARMRRFLLLPRSLACLLLIIIDVRVAASGNFIAASISWRQTQGTTSVDFEIWSAWRRSFEWPCRRCDPVCNQCSSPSVGDAVLLSGTTADVQASSVAIASLFDPGDGSSQYGMTIQVESVDVENDWFLGVTRISHKYSGEFKACNVFYPPGHYVGQPCRTTPWVASLQGCCKNGTASSYKVSTSIDLSDYIGSPRIVIFPVLYINVSNTSPLTVCSLNRGNLVSRSSGTIFWTADDNYPANYTWQVSSENETRVAGTVSLGQDHLNSQCTLVAFENFEVGDFGFVTFRVSYGNSWTEATSMFMAKGPDVIVSRQPSKHSAYTCAPGNLCTLDLTIGKNFPLYPMSVSSYAQTFSYENKADDMEVLSLRYMIATESQQSTLQSTNTGYEPYNFVESHSDRAVIPSLSMHSVSPEGDYITAIDVFYQTKFFGSRPSSFYLPISYQAIDHSQSQPVPMGWISSAPVETYDWVQGKDVQGSLDVSVIFEKLHTQDYETFESNSVPDSFQAITDIVLVNNTQRLDQYFSQGYILNKNSLLKADFTKTGIAVFIMYRKGQGPPITDITPNNISGYTPISAIVSNFSVTLYYLRQPYGNLSKQIFWRPCVGENKTAVVCANVMATHYGSAMQCVLVNVRYTLPPTVTSPQVIHQATMGKQLSVPIAVRRNDPPFYASMPVPSISISQIRGTSLFPDEEILGDHNWKTSRTGLILIGADMQTLGSFTKDVNLQLSNIADSQGFLLWTPNYFHGGWVGEVCLQSCVESSPCPGTSHMPVPHCQSHCIQVQVQRCIWYLQPSDSIVSIATRFKTNWLQIWSLNPHVRDPSAIQQVGENGISRTANVGHLYRPQWQETLYGIASAFKIPADRILDMNSDLNFTLTARLGYFEMTEPLPPMDICILPDSCNL